MNQYNKENESKLKKCSINACIDVNMEYYIKRLYLDWRKSQIIH